MIMKRLLIVAAALCVSLSVYAQSGVFAVREAGTGRDDLTLEEAVLGRNLRFSLDRYSWKPGAGAELVKLEKGSRMPDAGLNAGPELSSKRVNGLSEISLDGKVVIRAESPQIIYGETVSRNEFGIDRGLFLSPAGDRFAFYRKDESDVSDFPLLDITTRTGSLVSIKYPMAGMPSEHISLGVYEMATGNVIYLKVTDFDNEQYLTNVCWTPSGKQLLVSVLDRSQKNMHLNLYDASSGDFVKTILSEHNDKYVEPLDPQWFIGGSDNVFIYRTANRDGYRNLYLCSTDGDILRLTAVDADVEYIANDGKWVYYYSSEASPLERQVFKVRLPEIKSAAKPGKFWKQKSCKTVRLTSESGWHSITLSPDCSRFLDVWSALDTPYTLQCTATDGSGTEVLQRCEAPEKTRSFCEIDLGTVPSADGKYSNAYRLIKPRDFDPSGAKRYPVILYVYGGPHSQMVNNSWLGMTRYWEMYMAQRGYIVYVQDNRGTQYQGLEYEQAIWRQCGRAEMEDQMVGMEMLKSLPYVDADRIGVHGWSYGGFMTISLMTHYPETFKAGVAGGPVIDWKWYEVMYGERYMDSPELNPDGYEASSLINQAGNLKGKLLICQGAIDNTVLWQHSLNFIQECISRHVRVDYFPYPTAEHNVFGQDRVHLMDKVTLYLDSVLTPER